MQKQKKVCRNHGISTDIRKKPCEDSFEQGSLRQTDNPLDLALEGEGFFKVRSSKGEFYTRGGMFRRNDEGTVVDHRNRIVAFRLCGLFFE